MKIIPDCIPCTFKVCLSALKAANISEARIYDALSSLAGYIQALDVKLTPGEYHSGALHFISKHIGVDDPFRNAKYESNKLALSCMEHVSNLVRSADDPLYMAFKVSAAGNIIDMGILPDFNLDAAIDEIPRNRFYIDCYEEFRKLALSTGSVMIVGDNSGEIAFDILLVRELQKLGIDVVYSVKSGPVLNDATMEDAVQVGMTGVCRVVANGNNLLGTDFTACSEEFLSEFGKAGAIILKGQANYESLEGTAEAGDKSFFVLKIKCESLAKYAGAPFGSILFKRNKVNCRNGIK
ncbi:MAG: damage-control phosphatase ARMT1 family protein [Bacillota bacterium]